MNRGYLTNERWEGRKLPPLVTSCPSSLSRRGRGRCGLLIPSGGHRHLAQLGANAFRREGQPPLLQPLQVKLDGLSNVLQGFFHSVALADATGKRRNGSGVAALLFIGFKNHRVPEFHLSLLQKLLEL